MKFFRFWRFEIGFYDWLEWGTWDNSMTRGVNAGPVQFIFHKRYYR